MLSDSKSAPARRLYIGNPLPITLLDELREEIPRASHFNRTGNPRKGAAQDERAHS